MITNILYVLLAIVILGVIVTVHEFGHYMVGRLCGIGIVEFSIGFGPRLLGWERKGIKYSLRAIPLGGYCAFVGEDAESDDPRAMNNQPVWKRFLTVLAGPFMNFVLAFVMIVLMLTNFYAAENLPVVRQVIADMPAEAAGLAPGDAIIEANGTPIAQSGEGVAQLTQIIRGSDGAPIEFVVERDGQPLSLTVTPVLVESGESRVMQIGFYFDYRPFTFLEAVSSAGESMVDTVRQMLDALRRLFFHGEGIKDTTGAVGIVVLVSQMAREGMHEVLWLVYIISLNLGIMNLLPIPALDGGRLLFLIIEGIRRKPIPPEYEGRIHAAGFILVIGLFVVIMGYDFFRLFTGGFSQYFGG